MTTTTAPEPTAITVSPAEFRAMVDAELARRAAEAQEAERARDGRNADILSAMSTADTRTFSQADADALLERVGPCAYVRVFQRIHGRIPRDEAGYPMTTVRAEVKVLRPGHDCWSMKGYKPKPA